MTMPEYKDLLDMALLESAFEKVKSNKGASGTDNVTITAFDDKREIELNALLSELHAQHYCPASFRKTTLNREGKKPRNLVIPTVRDRVLHTAIAMIIQPLFESEFEPCSFGYRPQRSYIMAVDKVAEYRDKGLVWVVDADILSFFDTIVHTKLMSVVNHYITCHLLTDLIATALFEPQFSNNELVYGQARGMGIPQGSPLSPMLANLYLDSFDEGIHKQGYQLIRYADDFIILTKNKKQAEDALQLTDSLLHTLQLALNQDKTQITSFDDGFTFLGHNFINDLILDEKSSLPRIAETSENEAVTDYFRQTTYAENSEDNTSCGNSEQSINSALSSTISDAIWFNETKPTTTSTDVKLSPRLKTLYVTNQGAFISKKGLRAVVKQGTTILSSIPFGTLDAIVLLGRIHMTTDALSHCMQHQIPVAIATRGGAFRGIVDSYSGYLESLLRLQVQHTASVPRHLRIARRIVDAKINNSWVVMKRRFRKRVLTNDDKKRLDKFTDLVRKTRNKIVKENSLNGLLGLEGAIAREYFALFKLVVPDNWGFDNRNRQPPKDPVNVLLSLGYTVLFNHIHTFCKLQRVNPTFGYLHHGNDEQPSLVLDLMEEFRAPIVDSCVMTLVLSGKLSTDDFVQNEKRCDLLPDGYKRFFIALEAKLNSTLIHNTTQGVSDYRRIMEYQVKHIKQLVKEDSDDYQGFIIR